MDVIIEPEQKKDYNSITKIHDLAFGQPSEGKMVIALRKNPHYISKLSLVARYNNSIIGHVLFFPIDIKTASKTCSTLSLAPMAVHPDFQNKGIGGRLIEKGFEAAIELGFKSVIVVGHPNYYPRFGFKPASKWGISLPFDVPDEAFLAIELENGSLKNCKGLIEYPDEYKETL